MPALGRAVVTVTARQDANDEALSAIREHVDDLGVWLGMWSARDDSRPDAHARRCANYAMDAIDAMLRNLHLMRGRLVREIRAADDASAARVDKLLHGRREGRAR